MDRILSHIDTSCEAFLALGFTHTSNTTMWRLDTEDVHAGWANCAGKVKFSLPLTQKYGQTNLHGQCGTRTWKDYFRIWGHPRSTMGFLLESHKRLLMRPLRIPTNKAGSSKNGIHRRGIKKGKMKTKIIKRRRITRRKLKKMMTMMMASMSIASSATRMTIAGMMRIKRSSNM